MSCEYFENKECEYYPCHNIKELNCLFCFCPLYLYEDCGGNPKYIEKDGTKIKDCSECTFPHKKENYNEIIKRCSLKFTKLT